MAGRHIGIFSRGWEKAAVFEVLTRLGHVWTYNMALGRILSFLVFSGSSDGFITW
jgi:hypothetical protein